MSSTSAFIRLRTESHSSSVETLYTPRLKKTYSRLYNKGFLYLLNPNLVQFFELNALKIKVGIYSFQQFSEFDFVLEELYFLRQPGKTQVFRNPANGIFGVGIKRILSFFLYELNKLGFFSRRLSLFWCSVRLSFHFF